jgi:hypothetical protein
MSVSRRGVLAAVSALVEKTETWPLFLASATFLVASGGNFLLLQSTGTAELALAPVCRALGQRVCSGWTLLVPKGGGHATPR